MSPRHQLPIVAAFLACGLPSLSGCASLPWRRPAAPEVAAPIVFAATPTVDELIQAVNQNSQRVQQLQADGATLRVEGLPPLKANLALERPRRFRLEAELFQFTGQELDLGSNDELFWLWVKRSPQPAVLFARHDEFAASAARRTFPIRPDWLIAALGLPELSAGEQHAPLQVRPDGNLELRSSLPDVSGPVTRLLVVDRQYGWVLEHHLYDASGQLLAWAGSSQHRYYPLDGVSLPHAVEVQLMPRQPTQLAFQLDVGSFQINRPTGSEYLWTMPQIEGAPAVNIAQQQAAPPMFPAEATPRMTQLPRYRGY